MAKTTAPISHHNQAGVDVVLLDVATTAWVWVAAGVAGSGVGTAATVRGGVAGWVGVATGVRDGSATDRDGSRDVDAGKPGPLLPHADSITTTTTTETNSADPAGLRIDPLIR
jgi:hypothetical protein